MAPTIPTHRPLMTATRAAVLVAVVASACSVYLALASSRVQAASPEWVTAAGACLAADANQHASH